MLTSYPKDDLIQQSLDAGAIGYFLKNTSIDTIGRRHSLGIFRTANIGARGDERIDPHENRPAKTRK